MEDLEITGGGWKRAGERCLVEQTAVSATGVTGALVTGGGWSSGTRPRIGGGRRLQLLLDAERPHQLQQIRSLDPQHLGGGGAIAAGLAESLEHQLSPAGVDAGAV